MGFYEKLTKAGGGYIFLSHSHDDIIDVRKIRNALEDSGFEPLCFYLKCLTDADEIADLIKREIDAREWFIFLDSENARKSKWVTLEREYITRTDSKKILTIDLNDASSVEQALNSMAHGLRIFLSCSHKDTLVARRIRDVLVVKDYLVYDDSSLSYDPWESEIANAIEAASQDGCVLVLLTPDSIRSVHVKTELKYALQCGGHVIPVILGDVELPPGLSFLLHGRQQYRLSADPTDQELLDMVENISRNILRNFRKV